MASSGVIATDANTTLVAFGGDITVTSSGGGGGGGSSSLLFSQTTSTTVQNTGTATTLTNAGEGSLTVGADEWAEGAALTGKLFGVYGTKDSPTGGFVALVKIASDVTLTLSVSAFDIPMSQTAQPWELDWQFTRQTDGGSGTVVGSAKLTLFTVGGQEVVARANTSSPQTVSSTASKAIDVTADWETADSSNTITAQSFVMHLMEVA